MIYWLGFAACAAAILVSGSRLSKYGDIIAEKYGLSRSFTGMVLLAVSTSLPELVTGFSSVTLADAPNIAVGDILGACAFNMLWFAAMDALLRGRPLSSRLGRGNLVAACFGILLMSLAGMSIAAGALLPYVGKGLAAYHGLGTTFVGNIFIAAATSMPELVVSLAALRMGAPDLAAGNLLGSNIFNILILAADDLLYVRGPLLAGVTGDHAIAAFSAAAMAAAAAAGMAARAPKKRFFASWESAAIMALFAANLLLLFGAA
ncbi:MAG: hypothetical protein Kow0025_12560 [Thermodesulfovibrionales bacterium]